MSRLRCRQALGETRQTAATPAIIVGTDTRFAEAEVIGRLFLKLVQGREPLVVSLLC